MNETQLRNEICRVGKSLFERGYVHATAGNISAALPIELGGGFLITPTDACLGFLEPDRLSKLDNRGVQQSGDRASKTFLLHRKIYETSSNTACAARCVIHTHSTHCVALTLADQVSEDLLPPITPYFVMKVGHVPVIPYYRPGDPVAAQCVADTIRRHAAEGSAIRAVMLSRLGPNIWHDTPAQAMAALEELEETAKLWFMTGHKSTPLSEPALGQLRSVFPTLW
jgi:3-dehydro-4-phosphotetronate decarboxylase